MPALLDSFRRGPWRHLRSRDVLQTLAVTVLALALTGGLLWMVYLWRVWRIAADSPRRPARAMVALVFGCRLRGGRPRPEHQRRLRRSVRLMRAGLTDTVVLLGGATGRNADTTESDAGARWLQRHGPVPQGVRLILERTSTDSLENLRHAREVLRADPMPPVALVSSRYHLARCALLARWLGLQATPVAAEPRLPRDPCYLLRIVLESAYLTWIDVGLRWGRLTGNARMLARLR